ncbi:MAG: ATP-binding protein [Bacteroidales bacterium]|nr:ATP-binding protein [Bacteroidales bacterium]
MMLIEEVLEEQKNELSLLSGVKLCHRQEEALLDLDSNLAQVVIGVRRSGKSTLCYNVLSQSGVKYAYVNFDDERFAELTAADLNNVLLVLHELYGDFSHLFLDEVQNVDGWHLFVNRLLRQRIHVVITGSNAKLLSGELATYLTGRHEEIRLYPFSFEEYCRCNDVDLSSNTTKAKAFRISAFDSYLKQGGFPELLFSDQSRHTAYIDNLVSNIINNDIVKRHRIKYKAAYENLVNHILNLSPVKIVDSELQELFSLRSNHTAENYVDYTAKAYLISLCRKWSNKSSRRIRGEKAYPIDVALMNKRQNAFVGDNLGWRLETIVYIELLRRCHALSKNIYYYEEQSGEADFMVCNGNVVEEIYQVSYDISATKTRNREIKGLMLASKATKCNNLFLITKYDWEDLEIQGLTIKIRPASEWLCNK